MDDLKILEMFMDDESLQIDPKEKRLTGTMNVFNINLKDH
jgi:hypothetical protein